MLVSESLLDMQYICTITQYKEFNLLVELRWNSLSLNYILLHLKLFDQPLTIMHAIQNKRETKILIKVSKYTAIDLIQLNHVSHFALTNF